MTRASDPFDIWSTPSIQAQEHSDPSVTKYYPKRRNAQPIEMKRTFSETDASSSLPPEIRAILPSGGSSYRPTFEDHQKAVAKLTSYETKRIAQQKRKEQEYFKQNKMHDKDYQLSSLEDMLEPIVRDSVKHEQEAPEDETVCFCFSVFFTLAYFISNHCCMHLVFAILDRRIIR